MFKKQGNLDLQQKVYFDITDFDMHNVSSNKYNKLMLK